MLELVKDNLGDISSVTTTVIIAIIVYFQNNKFNKNNQNLQEKLSKDN